MTQTEKGYFLSLFNRGGYVLDFSTNDFDVFTLKSIGVAVCAHYGLSKGKSLVNFINEAEPSDAHKLLHDLFDYYVEHYESEYNKDYKRDEITSFLHTFHPPYDENYSKLYYTCKEIATRIFSYSPVPLTPIADDLKEKFSSEYLSSQINSMLDMTKTNPTEAIGKAKELIESCCKTILDERNIVWNKNWDISQLVSEVTKVLKLMPKDIPENAPAAAEMKALLGNLRAIATNMAALRNAYGSGHGKSASYKGLETRHAKLAVGSGITLVEFLWETHEKRLSEKS